MEAPVAVAQIPVTWNIERNLAAIAAVLAGVRPGEIVVLPEATVSGYDDDLSGLHRLDPAALAEALDRMAELAQWQHLADAGAQVFIYLTHAVNPGIPAGVWRSHLISEAEDVSNWYLGQRRRDVLQMRYHGGDAPAGGG
jgi:predicted amidohydrolase